MTKFLAETQNECTQIDNNLTETIIIENQNQEKLIVLNQLNKEINNKVNQLTENNNCDNFLILNNNNSCNINNNYNNNNNNLNDKSDKKTSTSVTQPVTTKITSEQIILVNNQSTSSVVKPILLDSGNSGNGNGNGTISSNNTSSLIRKKSVTFDTIDEKSINKFIDGEVIVDQKNPFKSLLIYENGNNVLKILENSVDKKVNKKFFTVPKNSQQITDLDDDQPFITKDEILKQSKYVKTYIKNPDRELKYDRSIIERLQSEDESISEIVKPKILPKPVPSPRTKLQSLKYKYSPSNLYSLERKKKIIKSDEVDTTKYLKYKKIARNENGIKYPDLSDLKIKTGTDIDKTYYNPNEVKINVKKFDTRFKEVNLGSQDDLDEIAELTSLEPELNENKELITTNNEIKQVDQVDHYVPSVQFKDDDKKSLTNTVNSQEFQEYLKKKGLSLLPEQPKPRVSFKNNEHLEILNEVNSVDEKMEQKNVKKRSVLQRLFQGGIFSSKNRTNPKDINPPQQNVYTRSISDDPKNVEIKRVVLERASFNTNSLRPPLPITNNELKKQNSVRDKPTSSTSFSGKHTASISDGRSSSISSALTAADDYVDMNMASTTSGGSDQRLEIEMAKPIRKNERDNRLIKHNSTIEQNQKIPIAVRRANSASSNSTLVPEYPIYRTIDPNRVRANSKLKPPSGRNSAPITSLAEMMEQARMTNNSVTHERRRDKVPLSFENNSPPVGDGIVKPRVQRPNLPITSQRNLPGTHETPTSSSRMKSPSRSRHTLERQYNREPTSEEQYWHLNRSSSVDRRDNKTQLIYRNQLPIQNIQGVPAEVKISSPFVYAGNNSKQSDYVTPKNSREHLLEEGPKNSTPLNANLGRDEIHQTSISTVSSGQSPSKNKSELDPHAWAKLQQLKQNMDNELYGVKLVTPESVYGRADSGNIQNRRDSLQMENIYESTEKLRSTNPQRFNMIVGQPITRPMQISDSVDSSFVRATPQRNTIGSIYRNRLANAENVDPGIYNQDVRVQLPAVRLPISTPQQQQQHQQQQQVPQQQQQQLPMRSQSVLDNMTSQRNYQNYRSANPTPVIMRRQQPQQQPAQQSSINKIDIRNQVLDFCRRSMSRTPTKLQSGGSRDLLVVENQTNEKKSIDISPVSYASVNPNSTKLPPTSPTVELRPQKHAPEVPKRVQSLQKIPQNSSIYAPVMKRSSLISNSSVDVFELKKPPPPLRAHKPSETDSVFLRDEPDRAVKISPIQLPNYQSYGQPVYAQRNLVYAPVPRNELYGQIVQQNKDSQPNYGYAPQRVVPAQTGTETIIYNVPRAVQNVQTGNEIYVSRVPHLRLPDGRTTPITLYSHGARGPTTVVLKNVEQMYRPIVTNQRTGIPHRQQSRSAQQQQQIMQQEILQRQQQLQQLQLQQKQQLQQQHQLQKIQQQRQGYVNVRKMQNYLVPYESESGSEAGEVNRIMQSRRHEEDWQNEKGGRNQQTDQATEDRRRSGRREDPRRHTLGSDMLHYGQGQPQRTMDLEMGTRSQKSKKTPPVRGYTPINQGPLFDDDPGIMSEVETASTGFRRGGKQRSSLPVVRTPSKTLERPLGLVFLQYRSETKRALLPNEITSIDTVRALFVRSFPRQLTMAYLEGPNVKIYIHDASKDMFYELEDVRSHLREIRDRSVLRLFESNEVVAPQVLPQALPGGPGIPKPLPPSGSGHWDQDQSYFSEPEFDSEYQHQHIHKSKGGKGTNPYYVSGAQTLPRGMYTDRNKNAVGAPAKPLRSYGSSMGPQFPYSPDQLYSIPDGYMSSPERGTRGSYEEPYYSQYGTRGGAVTPIIDEEQRHIFTNEDDQYSLYGVKVSGRIPRGANQMYDPTRPEDLHRIRVEHMERQLANLTGLVQKALIQNPTIQPQVNPNYLGVPGQCRGANGTGDDLYIREKPPKLGKSSCHKSVSFEKSVSFSDDIQGVQKSHNPQHPADTKPPKPAIKSSTLPRTSSQERDRLKPPPPPKPLGLAPTHQNYRTTDLALAPEVYNHLRGLQKKAKDLRTEVRTLRRLSQAQAVAVREDIKDAFMRIRATLLASSGSYWGQGDQESMTRLSREEELYKQEAVRLEKDLGDLENSVESLRTEVINRRTRVNMSAVEDMALVLSRASKTVAELKMRYPGLESGLRNIMNNEMEKIIQEEKFMKDEPMRLESALRRCKKLTGTLVTLKRLASVQEQRLPCAEPIPTEDPPRSAEVQSTNKPIPSPRLGNVGGGLAPENALDALLDELQTFAKPPTGNSESRPDDSTSDDSSQTLQNTVTIQLSQSSLYPSEPGAPNIGLRRLHSYPSGSDTDTSPPQPQRPSGKPPVPERNADLLSKVSNKRIPPPPPPRTSSRSPLASPTSPNLPIRLAAVTETLTEQNLTGGGQLDGNNSSSSESVNSQDQVQRQLALELRHQELLKKQKQLQEQYARLQQMSKNTVALQPSDIMQLKKTGSESNLPQKMGLSMSVSGSMKNLNTDNQLSAVEAHKNELNQQNDTTGGIGTTATSTTNKVYETDIL